MTETKVNSPIVSCKNKKKTKPEEEQDPKKHWLKFKIIDEDNLLLEDVEVNISLPDDSSERKSYNKKSDKEDSGMIMIKNIDPGDCKIEINWHELIKKRKTVFDAVLFISVT